MTDNNKDQGWAALPDNDYAVFTAAARIVGELNGLKYRVPVYFCSMGNYGDEEIWVEGGAGVPLLAIVYNNASDRFEVEMRDTA